MKVFLHDEGNLDTEAHGECHRMVGTEAGGMCLQAKQHQKRLAIIRS